MMYAVCLAALILAAQGCSCIRADFAKEIVAARNTTTPFMRATVLNATTKPIASFFSSTAVQYTLRIDNIYDGERCLHSPILTTTVSPLGSSCTRELNVNQTYILPLNLASETFTTLCTTVLSANLLTQEQTSIILENDPCAPSTEPSLQPFRVPLLDHSLEPSLEPSGELHPGQPTELPSPMISPAESAFL